jgi:hypothetical protein
MIKFLLWNPVLGGEDGRPPRTLRSVPIPKSIMAPIELWRFVIFF